MSNNTHPIADGLTRTHTSSVTEDQIDNLGHMNVRYYGRNALAATEKVCANLGVPFHALAATYTRHHHEQMLGNELYVLSAELGGSNKLRLYHELRNSNDVLAATFVHDFDHPPTGGDTIELPDHGQPRSLELDVDGFAKTPAVETLLELGLAIRIPREVGDVDELIDGSVPRWAANGLIWEGEHPDGPYDFVRKGPNGERIAMVVMESRVWVGDMPKRGARIQSFAATLAVKGKIVHDVAWCYDLDSGEPLVVIEGIDLSFDLDKRRSIELPQVELDRRSLTLHPELAPS